MGDFPGQRRWGSVGAEPSTPSQSLCAELGARQAPFAENECPGERGGPTKSRSSWSPVYSLSQLLPEQTCLAYPVQSCALLNQSTSSPKPLDASYLLSQTGSADEPVKWFLLWILSFFSEWTEAVSVAWESARQVSRTRSKPSLAKLGGGCFSSSPPFWLFSQVPSGSCFWANLSGGRVQIPHAHFLLYKPLAKLSLRKR